MPRLKVSNVLLPAILLAGLVFLTIAYAQDPQSTPKSDRDKCVTDKDHDACKKYYRAGCISKDVEACKGYSKELMTDCGPQPDANTPPAKNHQYLECARKAQCWDNRAASIMQWNEVCKPNPDSPQCKESADRLITPKDCDNFPSSIF